MRGSGIIPAEVQLAAFRLLCVFKSDYALIAIMRGRRTPHPGAAASVRDPQRHFATVN
jgi:hypothetical protein